MKGEMRVTEKNEGKKVGKSDVSVSSRIGIAKGKLRSPEEIDEGNKEISGLFTDLKMISEEE